MGSMGRLPCMTWIAGFALVFVAGSALAAPPAASSHATPSGSEPKSIRISYHDLDLATPRGIAALYIRIRRAAADVCDVERPPTGTRVETTAAAACVRTAVAATVKQLAVPGLAALDTEQEALEADAVAARQQCEVPTRTRIII